MTFSDTFRKSEGQLPIQESVGKLRPEALASYFVTLTMNFGEVVQHASLLNKRFWNFQGQIQGQEGAGKWSPEAKLSILNS